MGFLDRELSLRWANDALLALTGEPPSSQLGRSPSELWPGLASSLAPLCARALAGETVQGATVMGGSELTTDGSEIHLRVSLVPAVSGGALAGLTLLVQDETERVRAEMLLRESELRLQTLVDLSCDGYIIHEEGTVVEASRGLCSLLGCTPRDLVGQPLVLFVAPESRKAAQESFQKAQEMPYEVTALRYGDQRVPLQVLSRNVTWQGREVCLAAIWDISAKKAAEEAATRAEYLREQLLGVVGHDLRTPLNALQLGIAAMQLEGDPRHSRQLMIMSHAARRMERMIHDLLDFTRARLAGGIPVTPVSMSLGPVVNRVVEEYRLAHPEHPILPATEGDLAGHWDEARLAQLLDNLLQNALRHSLTDTPIGLSVKGEPTGVTLTVLNRGPLLPPEEREAIFEPFRRGKRASGEGLGLGLYIAKKIAESHGGRISVESCVERGTSFKVWLPRRASSTR